MPLINEPLPTPLGPPLALPIREGAAPSPGVRTRTWPAPSSAVAASNVSTSSRSWQVA